MAHPGAFDGHLQSFHDQHRPTNAVNTPSRRWSATLVHRDEPRLGDVQRNPRGRDYAVDVLEDRERRAIEGVLDVVRWRERHVDDGGNRSHRDPWEPVVGNG